MKTSNYSENHPLARTRGWVAGPTASALVELRGLQLTAITPATLTADEDDWNPTGLETASIIRVASDATWTITGIDAPDTPRLIILENVGVNDVVLADESASSAAANRILAGGSDLTLEPDTAVFLAYDETSARWRVVGGTGAGIPAGTYELAIEGGQDVVKAHGTLGATEACDPTDGNVHTGTLDQDCTITLAAPTGSGGATLQWWVTQDGTGGWDVTFAATGGTVTDDGTITPDTTAGVTVRYILERVPGTTNDWIRNIVGGGASVTFGTPNLTLGTANAAGATDEVMRRDATLAIFDATVPTTAAFGDSAATGAAAFAARRDHVHGMPAAPSGGVGELLISDTPSTPLVFADILQNDAGTDLLYADV